MDWFRTLVVGTNRALPFGPLSQWNAHEKALYAVLEKDRYTW